MKKHTLSLFSLTMICISTILSIHNWPLFAEYGVSSLFYLLIAAILFFIPVSLVSAELATGWPKRGGIFSWVSEAFGEKVGFLAVWLMWISNVAWYPPILAFIAATIAFICWPPLAQNTVYMVITILSVFWGIVALNLSGFRFSKLLSSWGVILGTLLPGGIMVICGLLWWYWGMPLEIALNSDAFVPTVSGLSELVFFVGVIFAFAGMEMTAVHVLEVEEPQKKYPKAIFYATAVILFFSIIGSLAIGFVIPREKIDLISAPLDALAIFLDACNLGFLVPLLAFLLAFGAMGGVSTWLAGPSKGLQAACEEMQVAPWISKTSRGGMPLVILLTLGVIVTLLTLMFFVMPSMSSSFWILTALGAQLDILMYVILFAAVLVLRYKKPHVHRTFTIPGKMVGIWLVSGVGLLGSVFCFIIGFIPPAQISVGDLLFYEAFLLFTVIISCIAPFYILKIKSARQEQLVP